MQDIPGYEGKYKQDGQHVYSFSAWGKGQIMLPYPNRQGKICLDLRGNDGKRKRFLFKDLIKKQWQK